MTSSFVYTKFMEQVQERFKVLTTKDMQLKLHFSRATVFQGILQKAKSSSQESINLMATRYNCLLFPFEFALDSPSAIQDLCQTLKYFAKNAIFKTKRQKKM